VHEVKHDGYRLIVRRDGEAVRLFTRRGYDWTERYPAIATAAAKLRAKSFTLDGEAVVAGADGVAVFDALHRRGRVSDAIAADGRADEMEAVLLRPKEKMTSRRFPPPVIEHALAQQCLPGLRAVGRW
jgi:ATP-dependent DNA ligase